VRAAALRRVDKLLHDGGPGHGQRRKEEAHSDALDRRERDAHPFEQGVEAQVEHGNKHENENWVELRDDLGWAAVQVHHVGLHDQVAGHLVVAEPVEREQHKDSKHLAAAAELLDKQIMKCHPRRPLLHGHIGRLRRLPERALSEDAQAVAPVPGAAQCVVPGAVGERHNGPLWRRTHVVVAAEPEHGERHKKHDRRQQVREPVADVLLRVDHAKVTREHADVDHHVVPEVHALVGERRVHNHPLAIFPCGHGELLDLHLLGDQHGAAALEEAGAKAHHNDGNHKARHGAILAVEHAWEGRDDQEHVPHESDDRCDADGMEAAQVGVCNVSADQRGKVAPELVECDDPVRHLGPVPEGPALDVRAARARLRVPRRMWPRVGDKVGEHLRSAVEAEAFRELADADRERRW